MQLVVVHCTDKWEQINIFPPFKYEEGLVLNKIIDSTGVEYYFDKQGFYDGWGKPVDNLTDEETDDIQRIIQSGGRLK